MPLLDRPAILWICVLYFAVNLGVGVWSVRRTRSPRDFFIAGQSLGLVVTALATMATAFSGFVFIGGPGLTARLGVASFFIWLPVGFTAGLLCWTVGKRLRLLAEAPEVLTVPDALYLRYGSRWVSGLGAVAVAAGTVGYLGAQVQALGVVFEALSGGALAGVAAMAAGAAVVVSYTAAGGMIAGVYTDAVQGVWMAASAIAIAFHAVRSAGGARSLVAVLAGADGPGPGFLDPLAGAAGASAMGFFFLFGVGVLGQPHLLHKFFMVGDPRRLRWLPLALGGAQSAALLVWPAIGLAVPALVALGRMPVPARPDDATPAYLLALAPDLLTGLAIAAVLAAVMSTASSLLSIGAAALVRDLPRACGREPAASLAPARIAVLLLAVGAVALAHVYGGLVALLGTFAFGTFAAALAPAFAVGLNWRRVRAGAAAASIAVGLVVQPLLELASRGAFGLPRSLVPSGAVPSALALAASFTTLFVVAWLAPARPGERYDPLVEAVLET